MDSTAAVYVKYDYDLLRISPVPTTIVVKQDADGNEVTYPETNFPYGFKPGVGLGWIAQGDLILDPKGRLIAPPKALPDPNLWKESNKFKDPEGATYIEHKIASFFRQPVKIVDLLSNETKEKYKDLFGYLGNLTGADLESFDEEDFVDTVDTKHRLLMRSFYRNELKSLPSTQIKVELTPIKESQPAQLAIQQKRIVLDLREKVVPLQFAPHATPRQIPINKLVDHFKSLRMNPKFALDICLANCFLKDEDLQYVEQGVQYFVRCQRLDLGNNRLYGASDPKTDGVLRNMLDRTQYPCLEFVDITRNPLASIDRKDLFLALRKDELERLIFVPPAWIEAGGWKEMVAEELHGTVISTHKRYYGIA